MRYFLDLLRWTGLLSIIAACAPSISQPAVPSPLPGSSIRGVFEGITPCSSLTRPLPQIPVDTDCELMIWRIVFYQDSATGVPTTYGLESAYGVSQANTTGPRGGGTRITMNGKWDTANGTKVDPQAEVYRLYSEDSQVAVSFVKLNNDLLHVLNRDQTLMVGNAAWSYTLNRTDNRPALVIGEQSPGPTSTRPPLPEMPPGSTILGVFEGRLPCHEIVFEATRVAPFDGCAKIKSRLTLYQDQATGAPTSYLYMGTSSFREGTWSIVHGTAIDPDVAVYQLHLEGSQEPMSFLKADENHLFLLDENGKLLVGNALFSYTLSRTDTGVP